MSNFDLNNYVYITSNPSRRVFYIGVTNSLERRIAEHFNNKGNSETFAGKYYCYELIYFEIFNDIKKAICREKELKSWSREKKLELVKAVNPKLKRYDVL
jgi:putative endonuclease